MRAPFIESAMVAADPRTDGRWEKLARSAGSVFTSPPWIRAVCDTYGFTPQARIMVDDDGVPQDGFVWADLSDIRGERRVSLPFCDRAEPIMSDRSAWHSLAEDALSEQIPLTIRCMEGAAPAVDSRFHLIGEATWHGTRLDAPTHDIFQSLHPATRRDVTSARRRGVVVHSATGIEAIRDFHQIHVLLRKYKYRLLAQPIEFFERIWAEFSGTDSIVTLLAYADSDPIAGAVFLAWRDTLYCKFAASRAGALALRPNQAVYWHAIQWASERGFRWVDWGLSDLDQPGLVAYKRKWATTESKIVTLRTPVPGREDASESGRLLGRLTRLLTEDAIPDTVTAQAGSLLYRYFT